MRLARRGTAWPALARIGGEGVAFGAGFALVYYVTVRTLQGRLFGDASLRGALLTRSAMADGADAVLRMVSAASLLGAMTLVATVALARLARVEGLAAIGLLVGANVSALVLKSYLLQRPDLGIREVSPATLNSLPSGHVTAVFSAAAALLFVVPVRWRYPASIGGLVVATVVALATMSAGWHRAGDSMAAFLLVGVWAAVAAAGVVVVGPAGDRERAQFEWPESARWLAVICVASFVIGLALGAMLDAAGPLRDAALGSVMAFLVGSLLITGTGIVVLLGVLDVLAAVNASETSRGHQPGPA